MSKTTTRTCSNIARRTGTRCVYNRRRRELFFYYGDPSTGVLSLPALTPSGVECRADEDDAVRYINLGKLPLSVKNAIAERREREAEYDKKQAFDKHFDESRPDAEDYADFLHHNRCGVRKLISV